MLVAECVCVSAFVRVCVSICGWADASMRGSRHWRSEIPVVCRQSVNLSVQIVTCCQSVSVPFSGVTRLTAQLDFAYAVSSPPAQPSPAQLIVDPFPSSCTSRQT